MHSVSSTYRQIVSAEGHKFETRVTIAGVDYVQKDYGYSSGTLRGVTTIAHPFGSDNIQLGKADAREISLEIFGNSSRIPRNAEMKVYIRAMNETEDLFSEWIPKGTFFIDTRSKDSQLIDDDEVIEIVGMDAMMRGEGVFNDFPYDWKEAGKTTAIAVMQYAAQLIGVGIDSRTYQIMSRDFDVPLPTQYTVREALANVAGLYGGAFIINDIGYLQLICPWYSQYTYDLGVNTQGLTVHPPYSECTGVRMLIADRGYTVKRDDEDVDYYLGGNENGYVFEIECPWATQEQANWLYGRMAGYVYQPYQSTTGEIDPIVEIGDSVAVGNITGGLYMQEITFGKYFTCDFGAPGEEEIDHEYQYETSTDRKYTRRLYNAEATLAIHQDEIMARVTKTGGDEDSTFGWVLESDHWDVFSGSPDNVVLHVDKDGLTVKGDGEFTGTLSSAEIYIPSEDDWNFMVDRSGHMYAVNADVSGVIRADGGIYVGENIVATLDDLNEIRQMTSGLYNQGNGLLNSLRAAQNYNKAIQQNSSDVPDYFSANYITALTSFYSKKYYVDTGNDSTEFDLADHEHNMRAEENGDKIDIICGRPVAKDTSTKASFNIADTKKYKDMVSALTVKSITFEKTAKGTYYEIKATAKNAAGESLLTRTDHTDSTVWTNGYNDGRTRFEPKSVNISVSESSSGMYYNVSVTVYNSGGTQLISRSNNSNTSVYYNGYRAGEAAHASDYQNGWNDGVASVDTDWYYNYGYNQGQSDGYSSGYDDGWYYGYNAGWADAQGSIY